MITVTSDHIFEKNDVFCDDVKGGSNSAHTVGLFFDAA